MQPPSRDVARHLRVSLAVNVMGPTARVRSPEEGQGGLGSAGRGVEGGLHCIESRNVHGRVPAPAFLEA